MQLIGAWAFTECGELMSIDLPRSLHSIGRKAFNNCENLPYTFTNEPMLFIGRSSLDAE